MDILKKIKSKYQLMPIPAKAAFWLTLCSLMQKGVSIITVPIFTRMLSTSEYGVVSVFVSWGNILILFTGLSLASGVFNTAMIRYEKEHNRVVSVLLGLSTTITFAFLLIYLAFSSFFNTLFGFSTGLMLLMILRLLLAPAFNLWMSQQRFEYNYMPFVIYTLCMTVAVPAIGYFWVLFSQDRGTARIVSMTVVECAFYAVLFIVIFFKGRSFFDKKIWWHSIKVNVPLIPHFLSGTILNQADRIMIAAMVSDSAAGKYSVAYSAATLIQIAISSINSSIIPWMYKRLKKDTTENISNIKQVTNTATFFMLLAIVVFTLFAPEFMAILATKEYSDAIVLFPPLTAGVFFMFVYNLFANIELYYEKSTYVTIASVIAAVANVILNYIFIPVFGYMIAGYTTLIGYIIYTLTHYYFTQKILKQNQRKMPLDLSFLFKSCIVVIVFSIFVNILYDFWILRYSLVIGSTIFIIYKKDTVIALIKKMKS